VAAVGKDSAAVHTRIHHPLTIKRYAEGRGAAKTQPQCTPALISIKRYAEGRGAAMILIKLSVFLARQSGILALRTQLVLILGRNIWNHYIDWVENFEAIERRRSSFGLDFVRCRQLREPGANSRYLFSSD
jgi:hypothetical protein